MALQNSGSISTTKETQKTFSGCYPTQQKPFVKVSASLSFALSQKNK